MVIGNIAHVTIEPPDNYEIEKVQSISEIIDRELGKAEESMEKVFDDDLSASPTDKSPGER